jgi:hypothetical protein
VTLLLALIDRWRRRNHADLRIILTPDMAPEPRSRQFVTVYKAQRGHTIFCDRCRRYIIHGIAECADADKAAEWHVRAHQMEAV